MKIKLRKLGRILGLSIIIITLIVMNGCSNKNESVPAFENAKEENKFEYFVDAPADSWTCPRCGSENTSGKFCSSCGSEKTEDQENWICTKCGSRNTGSFCTECGAQAVANAETESIITRLIDVPAIQPNEYAVRPIEQKTRTINSEIIELTYKGSLDTEGQVDSYSFSSPYGGRCLITNNYSIACNIELYDLEGNRLFGGITHDAYTTNPNWLVKGLIKGKTYILKVEQHTPINPYVIPDYLGEYSFSLCFDKECIDLADTNVIEDSVIFEGQRNVYYFTPSIDGIYRFELSKMNNGMKVDLFAFDEYGEPLSDAIISQNGDGLKGLPLTAGKKYEIQIRQYAQFGNYTLLIGKQKPEIDISKYTKITDSIEFVDQRNVYSFTVPADGQYRFEFSRMMANTEAGLYVYNDLHETIAENDNCKNGDGITLSDLKAGEKYTIVACNKSGFSDYSLIIGMQKEAVLIDKNVSVHDSMEYTEQRNVYLLTPDASGDVAFSFNDMAPEMSIDFYICNDLQEVLEWDYDCTNHSTIVFHNAKAGEAYTIVVLQSNEIGVYSLEVRAK